MPMRTASPFAALATRPGRHARPALVKLGLALSLALLAGSCDSQQDAADVAVAKADQAIRALTADGTRLSTSPEVIRAKLGEAVEAVKPFMRDHAAAGMVAGKAKAALATLETQAALDLDAQAQSKLDSLRAQLDRYSASSALSKTLAGADVSAQVAQVQQQIQANRQALKAAQLAAGGAADAAAAAQAKIDGVMAQSKASRNQAAQLRLQAAGLSAQGALSLIEQAAAAERSANSLEAQVALLEAQRVSVQTEAETAAANASALATEQARLEADLSLIQARGESDRKLAGEAQALAQAAAKEITTSAGAFLDFHETSLTPAQQKATSALREALDTFKSASAKAGGSSTQVKNTAQASAKLGVTQIQQSLADALITQARAKERVATTMRLLASVDPALPDAAMYKGAAQIAQQSFDELIGQARETYEQVRQGLDGVGSDELKARLMGAMQGLELLSSKQGISQAQVTAPAFRDEAATKDVEAGRVAKALDTYLDAYRAGDQAAMDAASSIDDEAAKQAFADAMAMGKTIVALDVAVKEKFGAGLADTLPGGAMLAGMGEAERAMQAMTAADFDITIAEGGQRATARLKKPFPGATDTALKLVDGQWKLTFSEAQASQLKMAGAMLGPMRAGLDSLLTDIGEGKITSKEQLLATWATKFQAMMPGAPGGGAEGK